MDLRPLKIYSSEDTPRLRYIAGFILTDILGLHIEITTDKRKLGKYQVINYSSENIKGSLKIAPDRLLFERGIKAREIAVSQWKGLPVFFSTTAESDLPFDIFAASFFLITRYEEYLEFQPDEFGRFRASSSVAFKNGFLQIPVVDRWIKEMARVLLRKFNMLAFRRNEYNALLTIDADQPFAYTGISLMRSLGGLFRDRQKNERSAEKDPYEVFDYIIESLGLDTSIRFFFPVGDHSRYDKNPSWKNNEYRKLIKKIADKFDTGLHPSFYAAEKLVVIKKEMARLSTILGKPISSGRLHYIRLHIPQSYRYINEAGIPEDFSMGYPDEPGFRAGIARPYYFYDVAEDRQTSLKIIPFQITDEALDSKHFDPAASSELILNLINETRKVGGLFVSIWHNTLLLGNQQCKGWREAFEFTIKNQVP